LKKKIVILLIFSFLIIRISYSQRQTNIWYFGEYAGLDFNSGIPIPLTDGVLSRWEGVATMSDSLGNLLFYTDGEKVWNRNHQVMTNGSGLLGDQSSTECAIIVPMPLNQNLYYIITVDNEGFENGLCYSLVDMNLDNGKGDITETKNIQLVTPVSEKITAIRHSNNKDIWVVAHGYETDSFFVYKITETGINVIPDIYETGTQHTDIGIWGTNAIGYMRISPDGTKIACAILIWQTIDILNFNNSTGEISIITSLFDPGGSSYGVEFSPDGSKLYSTSKFSVFQIDLNAGTPEQIQSSYTKLGTSDSENFFGALQLATDGKIYLAHDNSEYLGVINNPNANVANCNFVLNGLHLAGRHSRMGLPNFIPSYFLPPDFTYNITCEGDTTHFSLASISNIDSVLWTFGDETSGIENSSKLISPKHFYKKNGTYYVQLSMFIDGVEHKKNQVVKINPLPNLNLGNDTIICKNDTLNINISQENVNYLWNNLSTDSLLKITNAGTYFAKIENNYTHCKNFDTINIAIAQLPVFDLGNDTSFCINDSIRIGYNFKKATFLWNTLQTDSFIYIKNIGEYSLQIIDSLGCKNTDKILLNNYSLPTINLGNDTIICPETQIELNAWQNGAKYLWKNNSTNFNLIIEKSDTIWLQLTDKNKCINSDTIIITQKYNPEVQLQNDTIICGNEVFMLTSKTKFVSKNDFLWNDNSSDSILFINQKGIYWLKVKNVCGEITDSITIDLKYCGDVWIPNIITPNNDNQNDFFIIKGIENQQWKMQIYNRWGNLIYETNYYLNDWNAENNPDGVYYYIFSNEFFDKIYNGEIHVYR